MLTRFFPESRCYHPPTKFLLKRHGFGGVYSCGGCLVSSNTAPVNGQDLLAEFMQYGRQGPFEEIVRRYAGMVFNVCLRVTKDKHDAEDATQAVFLTLAIQVRRGAQIKALGPWLQQVAKRLSLDLRRSKSRRVVREERHHAEQTNRMNGNGDALPQVDLEEVKIILHEELDKLPAKYRLPLILHYFGGLSREEMAAELGCKPSTLGVRIFRGREMLAGRLNGRGINMSSGTFAVALAYTVRSAVSHAMISTTSHAASALAVGHNGIGLVSGRVIGLSRRAAGALVLGKVKLATVAMLIALSSLGAGAKAFGMLPHIDLSRIIAEQVRRLISPVIHPLNFQLRVDAAPTPKTVVPQSQLSQPLVITPTPSFAMTAPKPIVPKAIPAADSVATAVITSSPVTPRLSNFEPSAQSHAAAITDAPADPIANAGHPVATVQTADAAPSFAGGGGGGGGSADNSMAAGGSHAPAPLAKSTPAYAVNGMPVLTGAAAKNLFVAPSSKHSTPVASNSGSTPTADGTNTGIANTSVAMDSLAYAGFSMGAYGSLESETAGATSYVTTTPVAAPATVQEVRIPAVGGTVISSDGLLSGYGKVNYSGTLDVCGQVVATGHGVDRTLNLTSFQVIKDSSDDSAGAPHPGWFAEDHGRLMLRLLASADGSTLNWGEDPTDPSLDMVNAVRLMNVVTPTGKAPVQMALLSPDRTDVPDLSEISGVPVGLWQVDPSLDQIDSADLSIHYDPSAVLALGDSESDVQLWAMSNGAWEQLSAASVVLDTSNNTISGSATNFDYFAVTAPAGNGVDISNLIATPAQLVLPGTSEVPEPVGLSMIGLTAAGLLARRRRR